MIGDAGGGYQQPGVLNLFITLMLNMVFDNGTFRDVQNVFFKFSFGFEKNCGFSSVLKKPSVWFSLYISCKIQKNTCKLSFLCVHFAFWSTVF